MNTDMLRKAQTEWEQARLWGKQVGRSLIYNKNSSSTAGRNGPPGTNTLAPATSASSLSDQHKVCPRARAPSGCPVTEPCDLLGSLSG